MKGDKSQEAAKHSIYAEPTFIVGQSEFPAQVDHDLACTKCGFNRRALQADRPCPECGHNPAVMSKDEELARHSVFNDAGILPPEHVPPSAKRVDYANWLAARIKGTSPVVGWGVVLALMLLGGVWAVIGAIFAGSGGVVGIVVAGPVAEEIMKIALIVMVVETRPYIFTSRFQILLAAIGSASGFAVIENLLYLRDQPSELLVTWRWTVCTALHIGCTIIASMGAMRMWKRSVNDLTEPRIGPAVPAIIAAAVIHGSYNGFVVIFELVVGPF